VAYIGVNLAEVPAGLSVTKVQDGSPASVAGIKEGDVITLVDGTKVSTHDQLSALLRSIAPGTKVNLTVLRDGVPKKFSVTLAARP
jgi:S1-C subfamily serine protease